MKSDPSRIVVARENATTWSRTEFDERGVRVRQVLTFRRDQGAEWKLVRRWGRRYSTRRRLLAQEPARRMLEQWLNESPR